MPTVKIADRTIRVDDSQVDRFSTRSYEEQGCHVWRGRLDRDGYGVHKLGRDNVFRAHRFSYMLRHGPIDADEQLDHLCRNRACVNPDHLEVVTTAENTRRGLIVELRPPSTTCRNGHEIMPATEYITPAGTRSCRICHAESSRRWRARRGLAYA